MLSRRSQYEQMLSGTDLNGISPMGFLLKKARHGKYLNAYRMKPINTDYFRDKLMLTLKSVYDKYKTREIKIKDIHADVDDNAVVILDVNEYQTIKSTIEQIFQDAETMPMDSLKSTARAKFSAMLFDIPDGKSVISIDTVEVFFKNVFEKGIFVATYDETAVEEMKHDSALVFRYELPCIYFEEEEKLLVLDRKKTEGIFNLLEHYQKNARTKFVELVDENIVEIDSAVLDSELKNITTARKINSMIKTDEFTKDIDFYKEYKSKSSDFDDKLAQITIKNDKVIISNKDDLLAFLHITRDAVIESMMYPDKKYISYVKRPIKRKQVDSNQLKA